MRKGPNWVLRVGLPLAALYLTWGVWPYIFGESLIRWTTVTTTSYSGGVEVRTTALHEVLAFIVGPDFFLPFPFHHVNEDYERVVFVNGRQRLRFTTMDAVHIYPSPSGKYLVTRTFLTHSEPIRIYHLLSDTKVALNEEVVKKELPGRPYMVTFEFVRWEDNDHFLLEVKGHGSPDCRQTWRVDADSGSHELSASTSSPATRPPR